MTDSAVSLLFFWCPLYMSYGTELRMPLSRRQESFPTRSGRIVFKNLKNEEFWGSLMIGTPPQKFEAMFDTGSHLLWVPNKRCSNCYGKNKFDEALSSSYIDMKKTIFMNYVIGYMEGLVGKDIVNIAGIQVKDQEIATALEAANQENLYDGIVGLSFSPEGSTKSTTLIDNFLKKRLLKRNIISFYMNRKGDPNDGGELVIGGWNEKLFDSRSIDYIPINSWFITRYWDIPIDFFYFGTEKEECHACIATIDTGHTMISGPYSILHGHFNKMNAIELELGFYFVKCDTVDSLPDLTFVLNKKVYTLEGRKYTFKNSSYPGYCLLGLTVSSNSDWVLGVMFLSNYYSIFDFENRQVAFAHLKVPSY